MPAGDLARRLDAVHDGHQEVHQGRRPGGFPRRVCTAVCPSPASATTSKPSTSESSARMPLRTMAWSSAIMTRTFDPARRAFFRSWCHLNLHPVPCGPAQLSQVSFPPRRVPTFGMLRSPTPPSPSGGTASGIKADAIVRHREGRCRSAV